VKDNTKACSRCAEFKSLTEFYRQGERYESLCKCCKQKHRRVRRTKITEVIRQPVESTTSNVEVVAESQQRPRSYKDLGFTEKAFLELVDFYRELIRLDEQRRTK
jgi:hypothetical protein